MKSFLAALALLFVSAPVYAGDVNCQFPTADNSRCEWNGTYTRPTPPAPLKSTKAHNAHQDGDTIVDYVDNVATDRYTPFKACTDFNGKTISSFGACAGIDGTKFPSNERHRPVTNSKVIGAKGRLYYGDGTIQDWLDSQLD